MKEFNVTITETLQKSITVEATSKDEALQMVEDMWHDGDIILDPDDFLDVNYSADEGREINRSDKMDVLLVKPGQYAEMTTLMQGFLQCRKLWTALSKRHTILMSLWRLFATMKAK